MLCCVYDLTQLVCLLVGDATAEKSKSINESKYLWLCTQQHRQHTINFFGRGDKMCDIYTQNFLSLIQPRNLCIASETFQGPSIHVFGWTIADVGSLLLVLNHLIFTRKYFGKLRVQILVWSQILVKCSQKSFLNLAPILLSNWVGLSPWTEPRMTE